MEYEYNTDDAIWKKKNVERISKRRPQLEENMEFF